MCLGQSTKTYLGQKPMPARLATPVRRYTLLATVTAVGRMPGDALAPLRRYALLVVCIWLASLAGFTRLAAGQPLFADARATALGGATTALSGDGSGGQANPAAWGTLNAWSLSLHGIRLYGLSELQRTAAQLAVPVRWGALAGSVSVFGYDLYRTTSLDAGFGGRFRLGTFRTLYAGIRSRLLLVHIEGYGEASAWGLTGGLLLPLTPFVWLGAAVHNLAIPGGNFRSDVPRRLLVGMAYRPSNRFTVSVDVNKEVRIPLSIAGGVEIRMIPALALRGGVASMPNRVSGGIGINLSHVSANLAAERHEWLGWTPSISLLATW